MKKLLIIIPTLFFQILAAQDSSTFKLGPYTIGVGLRPGNKFMEGFLNSITDSSVIVSTTPLLFHGYGPSYPKSTAIHYRDIVVVDLHRQGSGETGFFIGAVAGAVTGALLAPGISGGTDAGCYICLGSGGKAVAGGVVMGLAGGLIGAGVAGVLHKTFLVKGRKEKFDELRHYLVH